MNGPTPIMFVMLSAVALTSPNRRDSGEPDGSRGRSKSAGRGVVVVMPIGSKVACRLRCRRSRGPQSTAASAGSKCARR